MQVECHPLISTDEDFAIQVLGGTRKMSISEAERVSGITIRSGSCLANERQIIKALHDKNAPALLEGVVAFLRAEGMTAPRHLVEQIPTISDVASE